MIGDMIGDMIMNIRFILLLLKLKLSRMMAFRASFFGAFFADGALFVVQLIAFSAIYTHVESIGDWGRGQMVIFVGTFSMINALNMMVYFFGLIDIPGKIKRGDLDQYLTKPVSPLLRLTFENMDPGSSPLLALSALIVIYGASAAGVVATPALVLGYSAFVLLMALLYYDMSLIFRTIPFLTMSANGILQLEAVVLDLNFKVPGVLFKGASKVLFYFVLPYGVMATVPTQLLSGAMEPQGLAHALAAVAAFTAFALWFWRFGLRRYKSASS